MVRPSEMLFFDSPTWPITLHWPSQHTSCSAMTQLHSGCEAVSSFASSTSGQELDGVFLIKYHPTSTTSSCEPAQWSVEKGVDNVAGAHASITVTGGQLREVGE